MHCNSNGFRPRIMVIDDEEDAFVLLRRALLAAGYDEPTYVPDPRNAVAGYQVVHPDLVAVDIRMQPIDGFEVMRQLAPLVEQEPYLPIVVMTNSDELQLRKRALEGGAMDFVCKSNDLSEAVLRFRNLLRTRQLALENRRKSEELERRVLERTQELEDTQREILERLAMAAEFRDDDTGEHTRRVGLLSEALARKLGYTEAEARRIGMAALLHDLGKIGIPDGILRKPGKLTAYEFENVKAHTWVGSQILGRSKVSMLQLAEEIALTHHERWDGTGYPPGLKGEEIPMSGRIVALADVFDALTHRRPYKDPWSNAKALMEIQKQSGRQFDPQVVEAFILLDWESLDLDDDVFPEPQEHRRTA